MHQDLWIDLAGRRVFARRWRAADDAVPIVLLHDSLGAVDLWRGFPGQLAHALGRTVIAYDRLGYGRSDPHPGTQPLSFIRDEADTAFAALREQLTLDAFVLFGHSVGGGMAVACAARHADGCSALVTESAQAFVEDRTLAGIVAAKRTFEREEQLARLRRLHGDKAEWVLQAWTDTWLAPEFAGWTLDDELRGVRCPVLAIHGDRDEFGSERHPQRIAGLTRGTASILAGCGHVPHREHESTVIELVKRFSVTAL